MERPFSAIKESFDRARKFGEVLLSMTVIEAQLEKKRWDLGMSSDFNLCDTFKMLGGLGGGKFGIDYNNLYSAVTKNLGLAITEDEVFIMYYKLDIDCDGLISYEEMERCFLPRAKEYAHLIETRGGFYKDTKDLKKYFERPTRGALSVFINGYVECEVNIELMR